MTPETRSTDDLAFDADTFADRVVAVLAAPLAAAASSRPAGGLAAGSALLPSYLLDGLLEAVEWANDGVAADEAACMWLASLRWYRLATGGFPAGAPEPQPRWLDEALEAEVGRVEVAADDLEALQHPDMGTVGRPHDAAADSPAVLARAAVAALLPRVEVETTRKLAGDAAALTHGSPAAVAAAARGAELVRAAVEGRAVSAFADVAAPAGAGAGLGGDGEAWDALRAAVQSFSDVADTSPAEAFARLAAAEDGAAAGAADYACVLLAAHHGTRALPADWRNAVAQAEAVAGLAERWCRGVLG